MIIPEQQKEERRKAIIALMARWIKSIDTKEKAQLLMVKNQHLKTRRPNPSTPR
jgi:hypothetical protein